MGSTAPKNRLTNEALTTAYAAGATTGALDVGGSDKVTLLVTVAGAATELTMRFLHGNHLLMRNDNGSLVVDEITHTISNGPSFAIRMDSESIKYMEVQFKGNDTGTISVDVVYSGTDNKTLNID